VRARAVGRGCFLPEVKQRTARATNSGTVTVVTAMSISLRQLNSDIRALARNSSSPLLADKIAGSDFGRACAPAGPATGRRRSTTRAGNPPVDRPVAMNPTLELRQTSIASCAGSQDTVRTVPVDQLPARPQFQQAANWPSLSVPQASHFQGASGLSAARPALSRSCSARS